MHQIVKRVQDQYGITEETKVLICHLLWNSGKFRQTQIGELIGWTKPQVRAALDEPVPVLQRRQEV